MNQINPHSLSSANSANEKLWKPMGAELAGSWLIDYSVVESTQGFINATLRVRQAWAF
jgi:hypothetical protein